MIEQQTNTLLSVAIEAARDAGMFIQRGTNRRASLTIEQKSLHDYVSEIDRGAEEIIRAHIQEHFPSHMIVGEEYGVTSNIESEYRWIVDPLDGTTNFVRGIPHYAVSIAVEYKGELVVGVVYDPAKGELFSATKGGGARLNDKLLKVTGLDGVRSALLATGVPFNGETLKNIDKFTGAMVSLLELQTSGIRRLGSAALDLAYVAAGRYDGFWEANLRSWDIAAGVLLVTEAGGIVSDFSAGLDFLSSGNVIATADGVHTEMLAVVAKSYLGE